MMGGIEKAFTPPRSRKISPITKPETFSKACSVNLKSSFFSIDAC